VGLLMSLFNELPRQVDESPPCHSLHYRIAICRRMVKLANHKAARGRLLPIPGRVGLPRDGGFIICYLASSNSRTVS
jgi:hypothetical protein